MDKKWQVIERLVGIEHVVSTTAISLKTTIDGLFSRHGLSISRLRGQGYDRTSNMQGEFNGLKTLIMKENECAFYIHCFAHQLQLAFIAVAKYHIQITSLFSIVTNVVNVVGTSSKHHDILHEKHVAMVIESLSNGEFYSGQGLNQETILKRACDTHWGLHYGVLLILINIFSSMVEVLEIIMEDDSNSEQKYEATNLLESIHSFNFVFCLHLMITILGITSELSQVLQMKDQDIVNAMTLVKVCKQELQIIEKVVGVLNMMKCLVFVKNITLIFQTLMIYFLLGETMT